MDAYVFVCHAKIGLQCCYEHVNVKSVAMWKFVQIFLKLILGMPSVEFWMYDMN